MTTLLLDISTALRAVQCMATIKLGGPLYFRSYRLFFRMAEKERRE
jgi:hypothetical protein